MKKGVWIPLAIVLAAVAGFFAQRHFMRSAPAPTAAASAPVAQPADNAAAVTPAEPVTQAKVPDALPPI